MADLSGLVADVAELVKDFGRSATFRRYSRTSEDPASPWQGPAITSFTDQTVWMVFAENVKKYFPTTEIQRGDKVAIVSSSTISGGRPSPKDRVVDEGISYAVLEVSTVQPGPTSIVYQMLLRA